MEKTSYCRLRLDGREEISRYLARGCGFQEISRALCRHVNAISREIKKVRDMLNGRPRKSLNREKPCDVYQQVLR